MHSKFTLFSKLPKTLFVEDKSHVIGFVSNIPILYVAKCIIFKFVLELISFHK